MIQAMKRRQKEIETGTSDLNKFLTVGGAVGGAFIGGPTGATTGASLGQTVGGLADGENQKQEIEDAQKKNYDVVVKKNNGDFDKALSVAQAGGSLYGAMPNAGGSPKEPNSTALNRRQANLYRGYA